LGTLPGLGSTLNEGLLPFTHLSHDCTDDFDLVGGEAHTQELVDADLGIDVELLADEFPADLHEAQVIFG